MSETANTAYILEDGSLLTTHIGISPKADLNQFEKDCYDSGRFAGIVSERERIIKLLEDLDCEKNGNPNHDTHDCLYYQTADSLIALIKGEK